MIEKFSGQLVPKENLTMTLTLRPNLTLTLTLEADSVAQRLASRLAAREVVSGRSPVLQLPNEA